MLFQGQISTCQCLLSILILCIQRCDDWIAPIVNCCSHNTVLVHRHHRINVKNLFLVVLSTFDI